jgi:hypothetical protein
MDLKGDRWCLVPPQFLPCDGGEVIQIRQADGPPPWAGGWERRGD